MDSDWAGSGEAWGHGVQGSPGLREARGVQGSEGALEPGTVRPARAPRGRAARGRPSGLSPGSGGGGVRGAVKRRRWSHRCADPRRRAPLLDPQPGGGAQWAASEEAAGPGPHRTSRDPTGPHGTPKPRPGPPRAPPPLPDPSRAPSAAGEPAPPQLPGPRTEPGAGLEASPHRELWDPAGEGTWDVRDCGTRRGEVARDGEGRGGPDRVPGWTPHALRPLHGSVPGGPDRESGAAGRCPESIRGEGMSSTEF